MQGCAAVCNLSARNDQNRAKLGECGAPEAVVACFRALGNPNARVAEQVCLHHIYFVFC